MQKGNFRHTEWDISVGPNGTLSPDNITHAILLDIRDLLRSVRAMFLFFTVLGVIGLVVGILEVLIHL